MITLLSRPKGFFGISNVNQLNAIQRWLNVHPAAEGILQGDSLGRKQVCARFGITCGKGKSFLGTLPAEH